MGAEEASVRQEILSDRAHVIRALMQLRDFGHLSTGSVLFVGGGSRSLRDPFHRGFLAAVEDRSELVRRLRRLDPRDRLLLLLWYVESWPAPRIAEHLGVSRVHCYRLRDRALLALTHPDGPGSHDGRSMASTSAIPSPQTLPSK